MKPFPYFPILVLMWRMRPQDALLLSYLVHTVGSKPGVRVLPADIAAATGIPVPKIDGAIQALVRKNLLHAGADQYGWRISIPPQVLNVTCPDGREFAIEDERDALYRMFGGAR